jgi:hypothetical protein
MEAGTRRMQPEYARLLDEVLGTSDFFTRNCRASATSKYPNRFAQAVEAETVATVIKEYAPLLIPGLLQTAAYARAVCRAYNPTGPDEAIEELVAARVERAGILRGPTEPLLWAVLEEASLRRVVGGPGVMAEALEHIIGMARRHQAVVQVIPFAAGAHAAMEGALKLMDFEDAPPMAYFEAVETGRLEDDPATVRRQRHTYDLLSACALAPEDSVTLLEDVARGYAQVGGL